MSLNNDNYTLIIEWFHPERFNRLINATGRSITILKQFSYEFNTYIRLLVQFTKNNNNTPNQIFIRLKGTILGSDLGGHLF